jgi:hypothetical protein
LPKLLDHWLGPALFLAEWDGEIVGDDEKLVVRRARLVRRLTWDDRIARIFACDCADHILDALAAKDYDVAGQRACVTVARRFANGEATEAELSAAWDAARDAAWDAARAAARAAAWDAARDAAWAAAWDTAWAAERRWQYGRLADALGLTEHERARAGLEPQDAIR